MEASNKFTIHISVGSRTFPITVDRDSEEIYRKAEKMINRKLQQYASTFPDLENKDYMAMTLLDIAVTLTKEGNVDRKLQDMIQKVNESLGI